MYACKPVILFTRAHTHNDTQPRRHTTLIQRTWEDEDSPFNVHSEGYRDMSEMLSDASEIGATPGSEDTGLELLRELVQTWPQHQSATKVFLAFALMFSGKKERLPEAQQLLEEALAGWNRNTMAHNNLGVVLEEQGLHDEAREAYGIGIEAANLACFILIECAKAGAPIFANLGRSLRRDGDLANARRAYEMASRLSLDDCSGGACSTSASRYYLCLGLQVQAEQAAASGKDDAAHLLLAHSRQWLLWSMMEPGQPQLPFFILSFSFFSDVCLNPSALGRGRAAARAPNLPRATRVACTAIRTQSLQDSIVNYTTHNLTVTFSVCW